MKKSLAFLSFAALALYCGTAYAQTPSPSSAPVRKDLPGVSRIFDTTKLNANDFQDPVEASALIAERMEVVQKMHETRLRIIREDEKAAKINAKIIDLYKELAVIIGSKRIMRELDGDLAAVDKKIDALPRKNSAEAAK